VLKRIVTAFVLFGLLISAPVSADSDQEPPTASNGEVEERDVPALRNKHFKELKKAQRDLEKKKYDKAEKRLNKLLERDDLNKYELANVYNTLQFLYYFKKDYPAAIKWSEKVVEQSPSIPLKLETNTVYTLGQMNLLIENWTASLRAFERYLELTDAPNPNVHRNLAEVYWRTGQLEEGRPYLERHLQLLEERGKEPTERGLEIIAAYEAVAAP
jgi:tetratricopeptide (TPR) repeat protein